MTSWWRLRTQAYLVLTVLLFLIAFLGAYALTKTRRHSIEADELLNANFKASALLKQIEAASLNQARAIAKYHVTGDSAYKVKFNKLQDEIDFGLIELEKIVGVKVSTHDLRQIDQQLEQQRAEKAERIRSVARDLRRIILVALLIAIGLAGWFATVLYLGVLKPIESIKRAAKRIREGELSYRIENFRGVEELTSLREEFNTMAARLEELDRMKGDFVSTVSHELRTPLTALKEGLTLLSEKQQSLPSNVSERTLEICNQATKRLEMMIQNLLNHAKMESGFYSFDERPKNLISVLEAAIHGVKPIAERRGMIIDLLSQSSKIDAAFSTEGITHVIENLLLNAIKYGDNMRPIVVEVKRHETVPVPQLEVSVTNHGRGLLPNELTQVFERFFRASNAQGQQGVGLGLSVVKRIIEAHHGTVSAESAEGVTVFRLKMPQRYESHVNSMALRSNAMGASV
ncbi:MAG: HAMP domain-containing sensor histidine kinase [Bdellovibrionota bacterium]